MPFAVSTHACRRSNRRCGRQACTWTLSRTRLTGRSKLCPGHMEKDTHPVDEARIDIRRPWCWPAELSGYRLNQWKKNKLSKVKIGRCSNLSLLSVVSCGILSACIKRRLPVFNGRAVIFSRGRCHLLTWNTSTSPRSWPAFCRRT